MSAVLAVIRLEFARLARRDRTFWVRTLYLSALCTVIAIAWAAIASGEVSWTRQETVGHRLFAVFSWAQFFLLNLASAVTLCGAVGEERTRRTLPVLLSWPLDMTGFATGKLLAGLLPVAQLLLAGLPVMFLLLIFGGLSQQEVVCASCLTLLAAALTGAAALYFSSVTAVPARALALTAAFASAWAALSHLPGWHGRWAGYVKDVYGAFGDSLSYSRIRGLEILPRPAATTAALALALVFLTGQRARLVGGAEPGRKTLARSALALLNRRWFGRGQSGYGESGAPIFMKDAGGAALTRLCFSFLALGACTAICLCFPPVTFKIGISLQALGLSLALAAATAVALMGGVRMFVAEKAGNTLEGLFSWPVDGARLLREKAAAALAKYFISLLVPALAGLLLCTCGYLPGWAFPAAAGTLAVYGATFAVTGLLGGLLADNQGRAAALGGLLGLGLNLMALPVWVGLHAFGLCGQVERALAPWWLLWGWQDLLYANLGDAGGLLLLRDFILHLGLLLAAAALALRLAASRFDRLAGRG